MTPTQTIRTAALIALPFTLLPAAYWLAGKAPAPPGLWLQGVIWSLRVVYVGGAFIGWQAGRPQWFYPWLGFASYAAVAVLLQFAIPLMDWGSGVFPVFSGLRHHFPGILALLRDRAPGWLAQVSESFGRIYGLSPCRTDHPTFPACGRGRIWPRLAFSNPFSSERRCSCSVVLASSYRALSWKEGVVASGPTLSGRYCLESSLSARLRLRVWF